MIIAGAIVRVRYQIAAFAAHHNRDLRVGLVVHEAIDDVSAGAFQPPRLADVGGLVEARFQLHQRGDRLAAFGGFAKCRHDRAVVRSPIERLLDRNDVRIARRLVEKTHHHVESLVGVVQQHVLLPDGREHVAVVVLNPLRDARCKRRPQKIWPVFQYEL